MTTKDFVQITAIALLIGSYTVVSAKYAVIKNYSQFKIIFTGLVISITFIVLIYLQAKGIY